MSFDDFHLLRPWWLLALLPAGLLLIGLARNRLARGDWSEICDAELLPYILQDKPVQHRRRSLLGAVWVCLCGIFALAGPTWERLPSPAFRNDSALVIALDLSKSMNAADIKPSRLSRARYKIADLLKQRKDGQTALLVYSGDAFTVTPLTTDVATINSQLEALTTDIMPSPGSNTQTAIQSSVALLKQASLTQGHILLVTDGTDADSVEQAGDLLHDYRLSVLAIGTENGAPIPVPGGGFLKDASGNIVVAKLEGSLLSQLAANGHGHYQNLTANDDDIHALGTLFNRAETTSDQPQQDLLLQQWQDNGPWLVLLIVPWAALRFRKGLLSLALLTVLPWPHEAQALDWQSLWQTQNQRAQQAFNQQQYQQAAEQFDDPNWRAAAQFRAGQYQQAAETLKDTQTADGHYNRGNALAKAGQLQPALQAYQQALKLDPQHADAQHNADVIKQQLQQQQKSSQNDQSKSDPSSKDGQQNPSQPEGDKPQDSQDKASDDAQGAENQDAKPPSEPPSKPSETQDQQPPPQDKAGEKQPEAKDKDQPSEEAKDESSKASEAPIKPDPETERANQQLLKRIPDEPTGLLKRKFKYQYGQRRQSQAPGQDW